jgi:hypothetical protein
LILAQRAREAKPSAKFSPPRRHTFYVGYRRTVSKEASIVNRES